MDVGIWLEAIWSRIDQGFGVEGLHNLESCRTLLSTGQPIHLEIVERALEGPYKGQLRTGILVVFDGM